MQPNANLYIYDLDPSAKGDISAILAKHQVPTGEAFTKTRQIGHACVSLPTCGLALAESERVFTDLLDSMCRVFFSRPGHNGIT